MLVNQKKETLRFDEKQNLTNLGSEFRDNSIRKPESFAKLFKRIRFGIRNLQKLIYVIEKKLLFLDYRNYTIFNHFLNKIWSVTFNLSDCNTNR